MAIAMAVPLQGSAAMNAWLIIVTSYTQQSVNQREINA